MVFEIVAIAMLSGEPINLVSKETFPTLLACEAALPAKKAKIEELEAEIEARTGGRMVMDSIKCHETDRK